MSESGIVHGPFWSPSTKRGEALLRICERAFLADPDRTYNDLVDMGNPALAVQLRVDHQTGRLGENVPGGLCADEGATEGDDTLWSQL